MQATVKPDRIQEKMRMDNYTVVSTMDIIIIVAVSTALILSLLTLALMAYTTLKGDD
jgi:hypothetical protein